MAVALASIATRPQTVLPNGVPAREEVIQARQRLAPRSRTPGQREVERPDFPSRPLRREDARPGGGPDACPAWKVSGAGCRAAGIGGVLSGSLPKERLRMAIGIRIKLPGVTQEQ